MCSYSHSGEWNAIMGQENDYEESHIADVDSKIKSEARPIRRPGCSVSVGMPQRGSNELEVIDVNGQVVND